MGSTVSAMPKPGARDVMASAASKLWLIPVGCLLAGAALSLATTAIDSANGFDLLPSSLTGSPSAARQILATIAQSTVQLTGLVLSLSLVVIQLAMGQFSPRIVRSLLNDRRSQWAIGIFVGTVAFTLLSIRRVGEGGEVPGLTMLVAYLLALVSFATLLLYIHHIGQSMRVAGLIDLVGDDLRDELDNRYGEPLSDEARGPAPGVIPAPEPGVVCEVDRERLVELAAAADCRLELVPMMGDFVPSGAPLIQVEGDEGRLDRTAVTRAVVLGAERTHTRDPAFGFRKLVDIAERSIAQPFDDPTTAVQAIDRLHDCLRQLSGRRLTSGEWRDPEGVVRLSARQITWEGYVRLAFEELTLAGAGSPQVARRLFAALDDLLATAPAARRPPLERQRELLAAGSTMPTATAARSRQPGSPTSRESAPAPTSQRHRERWKGTRAPSTLPSRRARFRLAQCSAKGQIAPGRVEDRNTPRFDVRSRTREESCDDWKCRLHPRGMGRDPRGTDQRRHDRLHRSARGQLPRGVRDSQVVRRGAPGPR